MNGFQAYRKQQPFVGTPRIDLFLSLYDAAIDRITRAEEALRRGDRSTAVPWLAKAQLIVSELAAGRPHPLKGNRLGEFALDLDGGRRLVFVPTEIPPPARDDGSIDWHRVTRVRITFIGDYHD